MRPRAPRVARKGVRAKKTSRLNALVAPLRGIATVLTVVVLPRRRAKGNYHKYRRTNPLLGPARVAAQLGFVAVLVWWLVAHHAVPALKHPAATRGTPYVPPNGPVRVDGGPSISAERLDGILAAYQSPLQGQGEHIVALSNKYKIDDGVALAFFVMESRAGTQGEAVATHNFGNLRPMPNEPARDGYRYYDTWIDGAAEWFRLMRDLYVNQLDLHTVAEIVPVYAPAADSNDPPTMTAGILQLVGCWRGTADQCPADPPGMPTVIATTA